ncbi:glycoside hydrolase family 17 protein [Laetiporus sulphureus 93-53]|uniref:glucan endo-1,3-beta-D-glucosidase n=1 Tax=Laetiporus sulphureus 93-53 TaxID=1314785 RepID=A0A165C663_9APHY|nr:glycoside hydrolase family 17 protein [Laetiporus sulphureus 93-53]KZT02272.1 glycoside hydrolase family 17 protein [Laetiporus sulphureus 93-53]
MPGQSREAYSNIDDGAPFSTGSQWLEKQQKAERKSRFIMISLLLTIAACIVIGVVVGVVVSRQHRHSSSASSVSKSQGNSTAGYAVGPYGVVRQTNPDDPSTFIADPNLHRSFYGLAYTPDKSQLPSCGNSLAAVIEDIQLISQLTSRVRLYGADCNQSALVLEAIKQTKVNMTVWLADYNVPTNATAYSEQRDTIIDALKTYGVDHVGGVAVGNEFILDYLGANDGGDDANDAVGDQGAQLLISNITDMKTQIQSLGYSIPVGTSDAGAYFNTEVLEAVDFGLSNVHAWFANVSIDQAAGWTYTFFEETNVYAADQLANRPTMAIGETGWPSSSADVSNESNGPSIASAANLEEFLKTFVCESNQNGTEYFYFEFADEDWQKELYGGVEGSWGLFYDNRTLKPIEIPDC